jgi:CBS-domain-containing membrane protein
MLLWPIFQSKRAALRRKLHFYRIAGSSFGAALGIGAVSYLAMATGWPLLTPSFGATGLIMAVIPDSAFAQPRNVIGGHLFSSITGLLCLQLLGSHWWSYMAAVGLAVLLMQLTRTVHPPAASNPLFILLQPRVEWGFLLMPVLASTVILIGTAWIYHNFIAKRSYPKHWV